MNVTSAGWQVTLRDPMWHASSRSGVATLRTAVHSLLTYTYFRSVLSGVVSSCWMQLFVANKVKFCRKPSAPSIPCPSQAYGFEETDDGTLQPQEPLPRDATIGPAFYSPALVNSRNDFGHDDSTVNIVVFIIITCTSIQCFDAVGWAAGRASGL